MTSSYDPSIANIRVKVDGVWRDADEQERAAYIAYKSRYHNHRETPHTHDNGITIFRTGRDNESSSEKNDDPYMPTYFRMKGSNEEYPIIDMNDIYVFLTEGVTGKGSRSGAGWVKSRNYQLILKKNYLRILFSLSLEMKTTVSTMKKMKVYTMKLMKTVKIMKHTLYVLEYVITNMLVRGT